MLSASFPIRVSTPKIEGLLQVSKWIKAQVFLNAEEMQELITALKPLFFVVVSEPVKAEEAVISPQAFIDKYAEYVDLLQRGQVPPIDKFRRFFSCAMSTSLDGFYAIAIGSENFLIKAIEPVIQLQAHHFFYSTLDGKFHPMVLSAESISWGLQFSYPQLSQDLKTRQINKTTAFPNTALFSKLMKWLRASTLPTPFEVDHVRVNSPIRVGKKSLAWIKNHPQLKQKGIEIASIEHS
jgi:hypothetical protein